jgi:hypothetical protein
VPAARRRITRSTPEHRATATVVEPDGLPGIWARGDDVTRPTGIPVFERFFRSVAALDIDKQDIRRYHEFVDTMIDDIALAGRNAAKWNGRDVINPPDLPITKGLQERMREFDKFEEAEEIRRLPEMFGGLSFALARSFKIIDPKLVNPTTEHWERAFGFFRLVF